MESSSITYFVCSQPASSTVWESTLLSTEELKWKVISLQNFLRAFTGTNIERVICSFSKIELAKFYSSTPLKQNTDAKQNVPAIIHRVVIEKWLEKTQETLQAKLRLDNPAIIPTIQKV